MKKEITVSAKTLELALAKAAEELGAISIVQDAPKGGAEGDRSLYTETDFRTV